MSNSRDISSAKSFTNYKLKLHYFTPSKRCLWTIVGRNDEYWLDPELDYCTCKHYYFKTLSGKDKCQHLKILNELIKNKKYEGLLTAIASYSVRVEKPTSLELDPLPDCCGLSVLLS